MKATEIRNHNALNELHLTELADQMDPAIGEAASVMGAMATEVIRRSLRGGVLQIGRELGGYVSQQVELQIVEQRPMIEKAAAETATEVARGEVEAVRLAASAQGEQLAARIDDASRLAQERAEAIDRSLSGRLEETARQTQERAEAIDRSLSGRLEETARQTQERAEAIDRSLTGRLEETVRQTDEKIETVARVVDDTARHATEATTSLAQTLQVEVAAVETRTLHTARKEFTDEIEAFKDRARQATLKIKDRLDRLDVKSAELADQHHALKLELLETWRSEQRQLLQQIDALRLANDSMVQRLEILEQPRGIRRLFAWLFGKKRKPAPTGAGVVAVNG